MAAPGTKSPSMTTPWAAAPQMGGPYRLGDSTIFPVTINDTFTPESAASPAKSMNTKYLLRGIQHANPSRLRNVLHKLSEIPGMEQILMHYLLVDGICDDSEEDYNNYEDEVQMAHDYPKENATEVKHALNKSHKRRVLEQVMAGETVIMHTLVVEEDDQTEIPRPGLDPIKSVTQGAELSTSSQPDNRSVLEVLPQQPEATTNKRKSSRPAGCRQCGDLFDAEAGDGLEICLYHPGEY